jgi:catalase
MFFLKIIFIILVISASFIAYHFSSNAPVTTTEIIRQDEQVQANRAIQSFIKILEENKTSYIARGGHAKAHACVKAYFEIDNNIPSILQHGVFSTPGKQYKSWIRFSNAAFNIKNNHDANKDAHGMAIKLFNLYDDGLTKPVNDTDTQDFLMHDHPVFFTETIEHYNQFIESENKSLYFFEDSNPFKWRLRELVHGFATLKAPPTSPLSSHYFSNTAYKLGPHNIKFSAQSCSVVPASHTHDKTDPDFLRKIMAEALKSKETCFNFMVQLQDTNKYMPIEDPSIEWKTSDSPYITIARVRIPVQEFDTPAQKTFCENLSYSPWNSLTKHRPIGQLNRLRQQVYQASSKYRHTKNKTQIPTNLDW